MDSQFVRKIMIDSRFRKSGVPGNFTFELNRAITLPSKCAGFITEPLFGRTCPAGEHRRSGATAGSGNSRGNSRGNSPRRAARVAKK